MVIFLLFPVLWFSIYLVTWIRFMDPAGKKYMFDNYQIREFGQSRPQASGTAILLDFLVQLNLERLNWNIKKTNYWSDTKRHNLLVWFCRLSLSPEIDLKKILLFNRSLKKASYSTDVTLQQANRTAEG